MDIQSSKEKEESEDIELNEFEQDNEEEIYCVKCLKIPKYSIIIEKNKIIQLSHKCKDKEEIINFPFQNKSHSYSTFKCYYCTKKSSDICLECKKYICKMCQNEHIPKQIIETIIPWNLVGIKSKNEKETYICLDKEMQFFCDVHFLRYQYFCPYCKKKSLYPLQKLSCSYQV